MRTVFFIASIAIAMSFVSCSKDDSPEIITKSQLTGYIQKGPFLNGTSVSISELNPDLSQTGKMFSAQIKDNSGAFGLSNLQLSSPYVELKADGFYFNEVTGAVSASQLTLNALADVKDISTLNVNVISTLEKARVETLVAGGLAFGAAKKQAMEEILTVFSMSKNDIQNSELLDINKTGDDNGILLAISAILQGFRSEAELSELIANLSADLSTDGKLDSEALGTALISHAKFLNPTSIRENLQKRYSDVGTTAQIPNFEKYLTQFIENTSFKAVSLISYPETVDGKLNVLNEKNSVFIADWTEDRGLFSFSALTPKGITLKIKMEYVEGGDSSWIKYGHWAYRMESDTNWENTIYDGTSGSQIFKVIESGKNARLKMVFMSGEGVKIRISYFENSEVVSRTRIITVN
jgi:hypothetical protein